MVEVWKIAPGPKAWLWEECRKYRCIAVGWLNGEDYRSFKDRKAIKRALIKLIDAGAEETDGTASIWHFCHDVRQGHVVVANDGLSRVVGIGRIASGYLPPGDPANPEVHEEYRHARLVDWRIVNPVGLPSRLFNQPTVYELSKEACSVIKTAYVKAYPHLRKTLDELLGESSSNPFGLAAEEGARTEDDPYDPEAGDEREKALRAIKLRRGREQFRNSLLKRYRNRCLVTGCEAVHVLEAAHIHPYLHERHNHPDNGLILRADIHTLFDLHLLGIEPASLAIELHPDIEDEYKTVVNHRLACDGSHRPSLKALHGRYDMFMSRKKWNA